MDATIDKELREVTRELPMPLLIRAMHELQPPEIKKATLREFTLRVIFAVKFSSRRTTM